MSPELETLDQLLGGDMPLSLIRQLYDGDDRFILAVAAMFDAGEVRLLTDDKTEVPRWQWHEVLSAVCQTAEQANAMLSITTTGVQRIGQRWRDRVPGVLGSGGVPDFSHTRWVYGPGTWVTGVRGHG